MTVGLSMSAVRRQRGLTLAELSALSGVDRDDLGRYERGDMTPRPETTSAVTTALVSTVLPLTLSLAAE